MKEILIQLLAACSGSFGVSMLMGMRKRYLFASALGGLLVWGVYLVAESRLHEIFLSTLLASAFAVLYAELLKKVFRCPATIFIVPGIFPLLPGGTLYYTMSHVVRRELEEGLACGLKTLAKALAIGMGISLVLAFRELRARR